MEVTITRSVREERFHCMQVFIATVSLVTRDHLKELGVETMGEQALLLEACRQSEGCKSTIISVNHKITIPQ